jgi:CBS domain containing-hemolysin-like protein
MVIGTLRVKDLVHRFLREGGTVPIARLVRPIVRVPHSMPADDLIAELRRTRTHQAAVVGDSGHVLGLVTIQDVISEFLAPRDRHP